MHVPDGFLSPSTVIPSYIIAGGMWTIAAYRVRSRLDETTIPTLGVMTAMSFVLSMLALPVPGGTSVHASGIPLLGMLFGTWMGFLAYSLVLAIQALAFGVGGITSLAINSLALGFVGTLSASLIHFLFKKINRDLAVGTASFTSVLISAACMALVLGAQPLLGQDASGKPLFFPFGWNVTFPALLIPHLWVAAGEAFLSVAVRRILFKGKL